MQVMQKKTNKKIFQTSSADSLLFVKLTDFVEEPKTKICVWASFIRRGIESCIDLIRLFY